MSRKLAIEKMATQVYKGPENHKMKSTCIFVRIWPSVFYRCVTVCLQLIECVSLQCPGLVEWLATIQLYLTSDKPQPALHSGSGDRQLWGTHFFWTLISFEEMKSWYFHPCSVSDLKRAASVLFYKQNWTKGSRQRCLISHGDQGSFVRCSLIWWKLPEQVQLNVTFE